MAQPQAKANARSSAFRQFFDDKPAALTLAAIQPKQSLTLRAKYVRNATVSNHCLSAGVE
jgi:hypothetical protein